jgi:hypothetical protein
MIVVQSQHRQIVHETLCQKNSSQKSSSGVAQGVDPEFKPQNHKKKLKIDLPYDLAILLLGIYLK